MAHRRPHPTHLLLPQKLKEVDQHIAGTKDVYLYAVEEKLEREKIAAEEATTGNVIEKEILTGVLNTFEELFNNRYKAISL